MADRGGPNHLNERLPEYGARWVAFTIGFLVGAIGLWVWMRLWEAW